MKHAVKKLSFRACRNRPIFCSPKGGGEFRAGWDQHEEPIRDGADMNYSFKLSRRLARLRAAVPIAATFLTVSCADGPSGPASDPSAGPSSITISPESVSVGLNQAVQFGASTDASSVLALSRSGKGHARRTVVSVAVAPQSMTVAVLAPVAARLVMSPTSDTLAAGATAQFAAIGKASDGTTVGVSPLFTA